MKRATLLATMAALLMPAIRSEAQTPASSYPLEQCVPCSKDGCVPNRRYFGYYPGKWSRWPGVEEQERATERATDLPTDLPRAEPPTADNEAKNTGEPSNNSAPSLLPSAAPALPESNSPSDAAPPLPRDPSDSVPLLPFHLLKRQNEILTARNAPAERNVVAESPKSASVASQAPRVRENPMRKKAAPAAMISAASLPVDATTPTPDISQTPEQIQTPTTDSQVIAAAVDLPVQPAMETVGAQVASNIVTASAEVPLLAKMLAEDSTKQPTSAEAPPANLPAPPASLDFDAIEADKAVPVAKPITSLIPANPLRGVTPPRR